MTEEQPSLFDVARAQRDTGMAAVEGAAEDDWKQDAWEFLVGYLRTHETMFVDDLWAAGLPHTREDRALGPLFNRAARVGFMVKTGMFRPSVRSNLTEKPVWRSCVYRSP
jgi:hypothetical protein